MLTPAALITTKPVPRIAKNSIQGSFSLALFFEKQFFLSFMLRCSPNTSWHNFKPVQIGRTELEATKQASQQVSKAHLRYQHGQVMYTI